MSLTKKTNTNFCGYCPNRNKVIYFQELLIDQKRYGIDYEFQVFDIGKEGTPTIDSLRIPLTSKKPISKKTKPSGAFAKFNIDDRWYIIDTNYDVFVYPEPWFVHPICLSRRECEENTEKKTNNSLSSIHESDM